ncbi:HlyD family efflux transporter periplasmic adaptor subunit [Sphingobium sp. EM0848]|uniref:HlyD family efflux transporter periplasmic adaptor subunit n=1 Tax=Sphingobium sp. EM0848 TaxID=2743473 RepID=UPI00159C0BB6|nr:HlyD family efflux transporter periplasmic adaptor subunit [Sphingobium sp. EM0848]
MSVEVKLPPEDMAEFRLSQQPKTKRLSLPRRVLVGGLLSVMALAVLIRSFIFTTGYNTTLVADMGVVRAPVSGIVDQLSADVGDRVTHDQLLGSFAVPVGLSSAVQAGSEDIDQLKAKLVSIDARTAAINEDTARIRRESGLYRSQKSLQLRSVSMEASAELAATQARLDFSQGQLARTHALAKQGFISTAGLQRAEQDQRAALADRDAALARQRTDSLEAHAAGQGLFLNNGYSDVQYSTQRLSDLNLALSQLRGEKDILTATLANAERLTGHNKNSATRRLQLPLQASVNGRVWAKVAAAGESVREGDPIYMLADCSSFFAYFTVGRSTYSKLNIGAPVQFIAFSNGDRWPGTIVNMGVSNPSQLRVTSQISEPAQGEYLIGARITLDAKDQKRCPVGTAGRVVL